MESWYICVMHSQDFFAYNRPTEDNGAKIVAVDLQLMAPISGVIQIHGDITKVAKYLANYTTYSGYGYSFIIIRVCG